MDPVSLIRFSPQAVTWIDEGMVKRIRGLTFTSRVSSQFEHTMRYAARGIFNRLLPDVHISTYHSKTGKYAFCLGKIMLYITHMQIDTRIIFVHSLL